MYLTLSKISAIAFAIKVTKRQFENIVGMIIALSLSLSLSL
jgi:hypothetical protein